VFPAPQHFKSEQISLSSTLILHIFVLFQHLLTTTISHAAFFTGDNSPFTDMTNDFEITRGTRRQ